MELRRLKPAATLEERVSLFEKDRTIHFFHTYVPFNEEVV